MWKWHCLPPLGAGNLDLKGIKEIALSGVAGWVNLHLS